MFKIIRRHSKLASSIVVQDFNPALRELNFSALENKIVHLFALRNVKSCQVDFSKAAQLSVFFVKEGLLNKLVEDKATNKVDSTLAEDDEHRDRHV